MAGRSKRMEEKLDRIVDTQSMQAVNLARLTVSVEDHVKRTNLLEQSIEPVKKHVAMVNGALKLIALLGIIASIVETVHILFK